MWTLSGVAAYAGALAAEAVAARTALSPATAARVGGAVLVAAGLYQLTPLKDLCLSKCRTPITFIMTSWHDGAAGALRMGLLHGAYCLGCCWLLFVILFPLGIMNIAAMAVITLVIFAEKTLPWGRTAARVRRSRTHNLWFDSPSGATTPADLLREPRHGHATGHADADGDA